MVTARSVKTLIMRRKGMLSGVVRKFREDV